MDPREPTVISSGKEHSGGENRTPSLLAFCGNLKMMTHHLEMPAGPRVTTLTQVYDLGGRHKSGRRGRGIRSTRSSGINLAEGVVVFAEEFE
ncbi:hypothetical protein RND71_009717 [Anisodus tanguticus]|uniref:Uncharacterized protein n=1 Tax=Anisodus tanguticus TaxID=243964 RepID=A0AAE1SIA1_9SOLA|nr:hypothetical protein RND71_009717 [Anisodus tanguticus]